MSASCTTVFDAVAFRLLEALKHYDEDSAAMLGAGSALERYSSCSDHMDRIRMYSSELPEVRAQCVELLIAHAELVHFLWRVQSGGPHEGGEPTQAAQGVRARQREAVRKLREACEQLVMRPSPGAPRGAWGGR